MIAIQAPDKCNSLHISVPPNFCGFAGAHRAAIFRMTARDLFDREIRDVFERGGLDPDQGRPGTTGKGQSNELEVDPRSARN